MLQKKKKRECEQHQFPLKTCHGATTLHHCPQLPLKTAAGPTKPFKFPGDKTHPFHRLFNLLATKKEIAKPSSQNHLPSQLVSLWGAQLSPFSVPQSQNKKISRKW